MTVEWSTKEIWSLHFFFFFFNSTGALIKTTDPFLRRPGTFTSTSAAIIISCHPYSNSASTIQSLPKPFRRCHTLSNHITAFFMKGSRLLMSSSRLHLLTILGRMHNTETSDRPRQWKKRGAADTMLLGKPRNLESGLSQNASHQLLTRHFCHWIFKQQQQSLSGLTLHRRQCGGKMRQIPNSWKTADICQQLADHTAVNFL